MYFNRRFSMKEEIVEKTPEINQREGHIKKRHKEKILKYLWSDVKSQNLSTLDNTLSYEEVNLEELDPDGTLLHYAVQKRFPEVVKVLVRHGSPEVPDKVKGFSPMVFAIEHGYSDIVEAILNNRQLLEDESLVVKTPYEQRTELQVAVKFNQVEIVPILAKNDRVNINDVDIYGMTALHLAAAMGFDTINSILLSQGANVNQIDKTGRIALHHAVEMNRPQTAKLLIENKANIFAQNKYGKTALHLACQQSNLPIVKLLLHLDAPVNMRDINGKTALDYAHDSNIRSLLQTFSAESAENNSETDTEPRLHLVLEIPLKDKNGKDYSKNLKYYTDPEWLKPDYLERKPEETDATMQSGLNKVGKSASVPCINNQNMDNNRKKFSFRKYVNVLMSRKSRSKKTSVFTIANAESIIEESANDDFGAVRYPSSDSVICKMKKNDRMLEKSENASGDISKPEIVETKAQINYSFKESPKTAVAEKVHTNNENSLNNMSLTKEVQTISNPASDKDTSFIFSLLTLKSTTTLNKSMSEEEVENLSIGKSIGASNKPDSSNRSTLTALIQEEPDSITMEGIDNEAYVVIDFLTDKTVEDNQNEKVDGIGINESKDDSDSFVELFIDHASLKDSKDGTCAFDNRSMSVG